MEKALIVIALIVFAGAVYLFVRPNTQKPVATLPQVIEQPTQTLPSPTPNMSSVKTEDIVVGEGAEAVPGKKVSVQYRGTLTDGTEFDSSYSRNNEPLEFEVGAGQMIQGFDYGVQGMKVGGTRNMIIPPELGYGNRAMGDKIPANSTLVFEVTLEKVE